MGILLLLLMVAALLLVELVRTRRLRHPGVSAAAVDRPEPMLPPFVPYGTFVAPTHSWLRFAADGALWLGIDALLSDAAGKIDAIEVPPLGTRVKSGDPLFQLSLGEKRLVVVAPTDGEVVRTNPRVLTDTSEVTGDPYGLGWLLKLRPTDHKEALETLHVGDGAIAFLRREYARLVALVTSASGAGSPTLSYAADGAVLERGLLRKLPAGAIGGFQELFLDA